MTRILHIITRLDMGGSAQNTLITCHKLSRKYEMMLAHGPSLESDMTDAEKASVELGIEAARKKGVRIVSILPLVRRICPIKDLKAFCSLVRLILKENPDIVHTHTSKAGILGRLAAKVAGVPYIVHTPHGHIFYGYFGTVASRIFLWLERIFSSFTHRLIALTDGEKNDYIDRSMCSSQKLVKIHSGVDIEKFKTVNISPSDKKRSLGLDQNGLVVGFIGWLLPIKGPMYLLNAMEDVRQEHPDVQLVFIGKGDLEVELRAAALKSSGNGRVLFLGWRDDIHEIMPIFDIFVLPSLNEGMGRVLVEAMAAGKPTVASNVSGIPDLVEHEKNGLLVPPGDEKALAAGIKQLIADPSTAKLMGQRGKVLSDQFSLESMVEKLDKIYREQFKSHHPFRSRNREFEREFFIPDWEIPIKENTPPGEEEKTIISSAE